MEELKHNVLLKCINEMMVKNAMEIVTKEHTAAADASKADPENHIKKAALVIYAARLESVKARYNRAEARALAAIRKLQQIDGFSDVDLPQTSREFRMILKEAIADARKEEAAAKEEEASSFAAAAMTRLLLAKEEPLKRIEIEERLTAAEIEEKRQRALVFI
jgi:hypothetical protein